MEFTIERIHIFEPLLRRRHKVSSYVVFKNCWLGFCWYRLCQGDILLRVHNSSENTLSGCINPFPSKEFPIDEQNRLALDRVKSISALSAHSAVKGLKISHKFLISEKQ